jgi:hypothetical protein
MDKVQTVSDSKHVFLDQRYVVIVQWTCGEVRVAAVVRGRTAVSAQKVTAEQQKCIASDLRLPPQNG